MVDNRDAAWLARWLKEPDAMLNEKDPLATALFERYGRVPMPNLRLSDKNVQDLMTFMDTLSKRVAVSRPDDKVSGLEEIVDHSQHMQ